MEQAGARTLDPREIAAIAGAWRREATALAERDPGREEDRDAVLDDLYDRIPGPDAGADAAPWELREGRDFQPSTRDLDEADGIARSHGVMGDATSIRLLAVRLFAAKLEAAQLALQRARGDWSPDPFADRYPGPTSLPAMPGAVPDRAPTASKVSLPAAVLLAAWAAERNPSKGTLKKYSAAFGQVARVLGFDDVKRIRADDVVVFKAARLKDGRDPGTVADDVLACGAVCKWAVTNRMLPANPFAGLAPKISRRGPSSRDAYDDNDAKRILGAARKEAGWQRWLPWLLCFTGARISEIAELRRGDVRQDSGVFVLDLNPTAERAGKNDIFQRLIPVHPALIQEGFLDYVRALPPAPAGPLFPDLAVAADGTRTGTATVVHRRWLRGTVGIQDPRKAPAHSWRHRMEDQLRISRAPPEVVDAITGRHNPRNAGAGYGRGYRGMPDEVLKELAKVPSPLEV
ncbi:hypothetical protein [Belnapia rosea]|uniref:hypothetical protein n=1 Tax=Belnapia rosea TaxID=938405 RepID=UPI00115F9FC5|nr:hypothetical protein [Belnapia rosea]